jgi:2-amino-4-hydroxy-6-hydroxymethyldihydropteridine diphosphokinase
VPGAREAPGEQQIGLLGLGCNVPLPRTGTDRHRRWMRGRCSDRRAQLQAAVDALPSVGVTVLASSSTYDTDPVGELTDQPPFLNACVRIRSALQPLELLDAVKRLERELGREQGGVRHGPRTIDIDILLLGELELAHERMSLPHKQLLTRRFVLIPALELDFDLRVPAGGNGFTRLADALAALAPTEGVRWAGPPLAVSRAGA